MTSAPTFDSTLPPSASPQVEFISLSHLNPSTELNPVPSRGIDLKFFHRYVRSLEESGYDYTLLPYGSAGADSFVVASAVGQLTERLRPIVALRPNTTFPTVGAQKLATLDQLTEGRAVVHLITGGNDAEQARQGDYLPKDRRYARTSEYVDILRKSWTEAAPFSYEGEFYKFDDFGPGFAPYEAPIPISIGGQSDEAFAVGGAKGDIFGFWGEPLDDLRSEIERVNAIARSSGRTTLPRIWDAVDYGRYVLPLVREELAHRQATGQRGTLQAEHLGNYDPRYSEYAAAAAGTLA